MTNIITLNQHTANPFNLEDSELIFPVVRRKLEGVGRNGERLPVAKHVGVYRNSDAGPVNLGVVGDDYKIMPNKKVFEAAEAGFLKSLTPAQIDGVEVRDSMSYHGAWCERRYVFPAIGGQIESLGGAKSKVGYQAIISNSYDGSSSLRMITGLIDFYCENGMIVGSMIDKSRRRHTKGLTEDYVALVIDQSLESLQEEIRRLEVLNRTAVDHDMARKFFESRFSETRANKLMDQFDNEVADRGATAWAVLSAMTFYSSHNSELFPVRQTGQDNTAKVLADRAEEVATVLASNDWQQLIAA